MEESINFFPLLLVLLLAFIVPLLVGRIRWLPIVVGEIAAGIVIGTSGLGLVGHSAILEILSNMGLAFLMFLAGMEINLNQLIPVNGKSQSSTDRDLLRLTAAAYLLTLLLAVPGGFAINALGFNGSPWLLAFVLTATSLGVVLPTLKQRELMPTLLGRSVFYSALLADFLTVLLLTFYLIMIQRGLNYEILSVSLLFLAFLVTYQLGARVYRLTVIQSLIRELSHVTVQIKVRGALTILMAFVVLASALGVEIILGAFLAGMAVALLRAPEDHEVVDKLEAFGYGFFIPIFFILVGANLDLRVLFESPRSLLFLPLLFVIAMAVKTLPMLLFRRMLSWRETLAGAALVNTHLSIEIAVAVIGVRLGLLGPAANVTVVLFATLTVLIMPVLFNLLLPKNPQEPKRFLLIYGSGDLGRQVASILRQHGETVRFLGSDPSIANQTAPVDSETIPGQSIPGNLEAAIRQGPVQALLVLSAEDTRNLLVCYAARRLGIEPIVALMNDPARLNEYRALGVHIFNPSFYRANMFVILARNPALFSLLTSTTDQQDVREVLLRNPLYAGSAIKNVILPGNITIVAISRNGDFLVPHGYTRLEEGDRLTLFGGADEIHRLAERLESRKAA